MAKTRPLLRHGQTYPCSGGAPGHGAGREPKIERKIGRRIDRRLGTTLPIRAAGAGTVKRKIRKGPAFSSEPGSRKTSG